MALRRQISPEQYEAVLKQTLEDLKNVSTLAEDLITLARSDSGGLQPRPTDVPLEQTVRSVADKYETAAESAGVQLDVKVQPGLTVRGDPSLLERMINNLIDNAIKYGGDGGRVAISTELSDDSQIRISVADDGPGMSPEEEARAFERFYRGESGRRSARGSGLGLAIVKAIVESHGGSIDLVTEMGKGTTVNVLLPTGRITDAGSATADEMTAEADAFPA